MRNREILSRQFRIVIELSRHPQGLSSERLASKMGASRATVNRDLDLLRKRVGLQIERIRKTGEIWHRLAVMPLASITATPLQLAALRLARDALTPLAGTALVEQLDALLALFPAQGPTLRGLNIVGKTSRTSARVVHAIEQAIQSGKQLEIVSRVAAGDGEERCYRVDPLLLRMVGDDLYLFAWSHARGDTRTFKVTRIRQATILAEDALRHDDLDVAEAFRGAVKAWSGAHTKVRIRLKRPIAWLASEYPLVREQALEPEADGGVIVSAEVAGIAEPVRWVLSWARNAEALAPEELRTAVIGELREMLANYDADRVRSTKLSEAIRSGTSKNRGAHSNSARSTRKA
ncbi:MAG: transcriptional regulator [Polyangiaceae bacterium]|nr:transcriptional regulator [Polyangiaceae bacterium]